MRYVDYQTWFIPLALNEIHIRVLHYIIIQRKRIFVQFILETNLHLMDGSLGRKYCFFFLMNRE